MSQWPGRQAVRSCAARARESAGGTDGDRAVSRGQVDDVVAVRIGAHEVVGAAVARVHLDAVEHLGVGDDDLDAAVLGARRHRLRRVEERQLDPAVRVPRVDGRSGQTASDDPAVVVRHADVAADVVELDAPVVAVDVDRCRHPAHPHRAGAVDRDRTIGGDRHREVDAAPRRHERRAVGVQLEDTVDDLHRHVGRLPAVAHLGDDGDRCRRASR